MNALGTVLGLLLLGGSVAFLFTYFLLVWLHDRATRNPNMNWRAKADLMVRRGEAPSFSAACSMLAKRRARPKQQQPQMAAPATNRLPYKDE